MAGAASPSPQLIVLQHPARRTSLTRATIRWRVTADLPSRCQLDGQPERSCHSPLQTGRLAPGRHTLRIIAVGPSGTDARTINWRVEAATTGSAGSPRASTGAAALTADTVAQLTASIRPSGLATTAHFEFGRTHALGHVTPMRTLGSGTSSVVLRDSITELVSGATYYYRVVATNASGTVRGATRSVVNPQTEALPVDSVPPVAPGTPPVPVDPLPPAGTPTPPPAVPSVTTGLASIGAGGWEVDGALDPRDAAADVWAEYGTSTTYGATSAVAHAVGSGRVTLVLGSLQASTTYHYRVVARNAEGTSYGADATFSTAVPAGTFVASNGDDSGDGSFTHPWRTLQKAADTVSPGTTVHVRGGSYAGFTMTRSGAPGAPIVFAGYAGETATLTAASGSNTVDLSGAHDIALRDLTIRGAIGQYNAGVMIRNGASADTVSGSVLEDNHSYGVRAYNATGIAITGNLITHNDTGVRFDFAGEGSIVTGNQIVDNQGMVVNDPTPGNDSGANAIVFYKSTGHISVTGNTIHGNRAPSDDYGYDGGAFEIYGASNVTIAENLVYDNQNVVETGTDAAHTPCANNVFVHNVAYGGNDKSRVSASGPVANGLLLRCAQNMLVANNTLVDLDFWTYDISQSSSYSGSVDGLKIENNVDLQHGDKIYALEFALPGTVVIDANDDFNEGGGTLAFVAGHGNTAAIGDIRAWAGVQTHGVYADPRVLSEAGRDFRLGAGSPAIDLGSAIAGVTDGFGGGAPDAGRYETN